MLRSKPARSYSSASAWRTHRGSSLAGPCSYSLSSASSWYALGAAGVPSLPLLAPFEYDQRHRLPRQLKSQGKLGIFHAEGFGFAQRREAARFFELRVLFGRRL